MSAGGWQFVGLFTTQTEPSWCGVRRSICALKQSIARGCCRSCAAVGPQGRPLQSHAAPRPHSPLPPRYRPSNGTGRPSSQRYRFDIDRCLAPGKDTRPARAPANHIDYRSRPQQTTRSPPNGRACGASVGDYCMRLREAASPARQSPRRARVPGSGTAAAGPLIIPQTCPLPHSATGPPPIAKLLAPALAPIPSTSKSSPSPRGPPSRS